MKKTPQYIQMKRLIPGALSAAALIAAQSSNAATVSMTADDTAGTTSFNTSLHWDSGAAPTAGNNYYNGYRLLRTPVTTGNYTFAGDSLTIGTGTFTPGLLTNNCLMNKTVTGTGVTITINNLSLNAGTVRDGMGTSDAWTLAGSLAVTANGGQFFNQCRLNVASVISGSGPLYVGDNGSGDANRATYINSTANTYNGSIRLMGSTAARARLNFADNSRMNFTIGASGVNNSIYGMGTTVFDGDFFIDLTGAASTWGSSWTLVDTNTLAETFSSTFTVAGWTDNGDGRWITIANGTEYTFTEGTGILYVPEPTSLAMLLGGAGMLAVLRRNRRS